MRRFGEPGPARPVRDGGAIQFAARSPLRKVCREGFALRGTTLALSTGRPTLAPDPRQGLGSLKGHREVERQRRAEGEEGAEREFRPTGGAPEGGDECAKA